MNAADSRAVLTPAWLAGLLAREPDAATLVATATAARLFLADGPAVELLVVASESAVADPSAAVDAVAADFARLFHGVGPRPVHPCESVWGAGDGLLYEAARAEMAEELEALGLAPAADAFREPEDHISCELEALAIAHERGDGAAAERLEQRLRRWAPRFARALFLGAKEPYLRGVALAIEETFAPRTNAAATYRSESAVTPSPIPTVVVPLPRESEALRLARARPSKIDPQ